jgi:uncharacterized protein YjeT (DUF2065 family)
MDFRSKKAKRELIYTGVFLFGGTLFFVADSFLVAYYLGGSAATFTDIFFLLSLAFGLYIALKVDVLLAAAIVSVLYVLLNFSTVKKIREMFGYSTDDFMIVRELATVAFFAAITVYLVFALVKNFMRKGPKITAKQLAAKFMPKQPSKKLRISMFGFAAWVIGVGIVVFLFEPYGYRMNDRDIIHMLLVMFVPSIAVLALFWVYERFVR